MRCEAMITWNNEKRQYEDIMYPGEKHNCEKFNQAQGVTTEASNNGTNTQQGLDCYTCRDNGFPSVKIFFNKDAPKSKNDKMIPLASFNKINDQWVYHTHKEKPGQETPPDPGAQKDNTPLTPAENEWLNKEPAPGQEYSDTEIKQLLGEYLNKGAEMIAWFHKQAPMIESIFGYLNNKAMQKASDMR